MEQIYGSVSDGSQCERCRRPVRVWRTHLFEDPQGKPLGVKQTLHCTNEVCGYYVVLPETTPSPRQVETWQWLRLQPSTSLSLRARESKLLRIGPDQKRPREGTWAAIQAHFGLCDEKTPKRRLSRGEWFRRLREFVEPDQYDELLAELEKRPLEQIEKLWGTLVHANPR
jgi:hypothetical protein